MTKKTISTPGYYDLSMPEYLADPCPEPALSTSVVSDIWNQSPLHAHANHPRLGKRHGESTARGDLGSAVHSLLLGGFPVVFAPEAFKDWRTKAAQEFRDGSRADNSIPVLRHQQESVESAAESARRALATYGSGKCEQSAIFRVGEVWARGRADWLSDCGRFDIDAKTVDTLDPSAWARSTILGNGLDIQAGLRSLGHEAITGKPRQQIWLLIELSAPYDCAFVGMAPRTLELARRKVQHAAKVWRKCLDDQRWPGFKMDVQWYDVPSFHEEEVIYKTRESA
jgi:hypothetical protein